MNERAVLSFIFVEDLLFFPTPFLNMGLEAETFRISEIRKNPYNFWLVFNHSSDIGEFISWCKELSVNIIIYEY